ncbi:XRE family transcriptional regulator [Sporosarcina globispora]|uniref:XRE family transcriptional regulator n=1 Tax=Sporosarcina globispora TaxID=1459 RepID=A0A0M0G9A0_SPOGL|nr:XRE family transcriptional regulator [Sporosarcina globispora]
MIFAEKLKKERKEKGWSQEELAEKLFVSRQSVSKWENGRTTPALKSLLS